MAQIKAMAEDHRRKIVRAGGDPNHPDVKADYLKWANISYRMNGRNVLSDDRLMSIAAVHLRDDADKPRVVPNGGADYIPGPKTAAKAKAEAAEAKLQAAGSID
jgi:hypothetical protein